MSSYRYTKREAEIAIAEFVATELDGSLTGGDHQGPPPRLDRTGRATEPG